MKILLTGGTGYIGSHACVALAEAGHDVILLDNLSNSSREVVCRLKRILGLKPAFIEGDIRDRNLLIDVISANSIAAVVHFAGLKAVGESVRDPLGYYENNVYGTLCLLQAMQICGLKRLVFSSSATVYGEPDYLPIDEQHRTAPTNPYGWTKLHVEQMLSDLVAADPEWRVTSLRYFNPVGAHESGLIGEDPNGVPNNLMPYIARVAAGSLPVLNVYGGDYPTADGTGVRDYIHVMDLAEGHLAALRNLPLQSATHEVFNLGTGKGSTVLEMVAAFQLASHRKVPCNIVGRRAGDVTAIYASVSKAEKILGWRAVRGPHSMCESSWHFQSKLR